MWWFSEDNMEIKINYIKTVLLILVGLLLIAGCILVLDIAISYYYGNGAGINNYISRNPILSISVSIIGILFFSIGVIYMLYKLFLKKIILEINRKGFIDHSTIASLGAISWDEVIRITPWIAGRQSLIGIYVKDINKLLVGKVWYKRKLTYANMAYGYPPITINLNSTKEDIDDVILMMNHFLEEWKDAIKSYNDNEEKC